jgi:hypothetical protein
MNEVIKMLVSPLRERGLTDNIISGRRVLFNDLSPAYTYATWVRLTRGRWVCGIDTVPSRMSLRIYAES